RGMRRFTLVAALVLAVAPGGANARPAPPPPANPYVIVFEHGVVADGGAGIDALQQVLGFTTKLRYSSALDGFAADLTDDQVAQLEAAPGVAFVTPDVTMSAHGLGRPSGGCPR